MSEPMTPEQARTLPFGEHPLDNYIKAFHLLLGHEKTAAFLGVEDPGREGCKLCEAGR